VLLMTAVTRKFLQKGFPPAAVSEVPDETEKN